jgi:hypothetical protein
MKTSVFSTIILILCLNFNCLAQNKSSKTSLLVSSGFTLFGDGDYGGFLFTNSIRQDILKYIQLSESFNCALSSNNGEDNILLSHNYIHVFNDFSVVLLPVKTEKLSVGLNLGGSLSYRSEINLTGYSFKNGVETLNYTNSNSFDLGYFGQIEVGYGLSQKTSLFIFAGMHSYKNGSGISSIGLGISLKL